MSKEQHLVDMLNHLFKIKSITYGEFNKLIPFRDKIQQLRQLEEKYPKLGIAQYDKNDEGISTLSIMATITDIFCNKRLAVVVPSDEEIPINDRIIEKIELIPYS